MPQNFCFTINNPVLTKEEVKDELIKLGATYCVIGDEVGKQGTRHYQGYVHFDRRIRIDQLGKQFKGHFETMRSTPTLASNYCKKDGVFIEFGELPLTGGQKTQSNWEDIYDLAKRRKFGTIAERYTSLYIRCSNGIRALASAVDQPEFPDFDPPNVYWFYGAPGTHKSRTLREILGKPLYEKSPNHIWWTDYKYEENVIIDEVVPLRDSVLISEFKRWLDGYPVAVTWKQSSVQQTIRPKNIGISSQKSIEDIFLDHTDAEAIIRRCVQIKEFISKDNIKVIKDATQSSISEIPPDA